jgi:hypothetical protein
MYDLTDRLDASSAMERDTLNVCEINVSGERSNASSPVRSMIWVYGLEFGEGSAKHRRTSASGGRRR